MPRLNRVLVVCHKPLLRSMCKSQTVPLPRSMYLYMYICSENVYHVFCVGTLGGGHVSSDSVRSEGGEEVKEDLDMEGEERCKAAEAEEERRLEAEIHVSHYSI